MTKRDFEVIANIILEVGADGALCMDSAQDRVRLAEQFAYGLEKTNPRFDAERFVKASTTEEDRAEALEDQYA